MNDLKLKHSLKYFLGLVLFSVLHGQSIPEGFVDIHSVVPDIVIEMRYSGNHNFLGRPVNGYHVNKGYLTKKAAEALKAVQDDVRPFGLSLKIYDAYRPQKAVNDFVQWAKALDDTLMKKEFYPTVLKKHLFHDGYIASKSSHSRGSTVDITFVPLPLPVQPEYSTGDTLCHCTDPVGLRFADNSLDMGTGYDCFSPFSWTFSEKIGPQQRANRLLLKTLMEKHGFRNYSKEWWHFTLRDEPVPDRSFNFDIR